MYIIMNKINNTYRSPVVLLAWLLEAVSRFDNSRVQSTCYEN